MGFFLDGWLTHHESGHFRHRETYLTTRAAPADLLVLWNVRGELAATVGDRRLLVPPGAVLTLPPGVPHRYGPTTARGWEWLWVHVGGAAVPDLVDRLTAAGPTIDLGDDPVVRGRFSELVTAAAARPVPAPAAVRLHLDSCAYSLLGLILRRAAGGPADSTPLAALTTWVQDHLAEPLTVADLAAVAGWSPAHLSRLSQRHLGVSPMRYLARVRIREAVRLLGDTDLSVTEIARRVGFDDPLYFSRRFRELTGTSPTVARAKARSQGRVG